MSLCGICCNETFGREVVCQFCQNTNQGKAIRTCAECTKRYLLEEMSEAKCMICKKQWPNSFMYGTFSKNFLHGPYRNHLKNVWVEREISLIPSTIPFVQARQQIVQCTLEISKTRKEIDALEKQIYQLRKNITTLENKRVELTAFSNDQNCNEQKTATVDLLMPCPKDGCNGLIEKTITQCVVCQTKVCKSCLDAIESNENHSCDEKKVLSVVDINKNTKPCPKCATRIYKIEGCDMMFCTNCKVSFSWNKGTILTGPIHNPHYFEWQQRLAQSNLHNQNPNTENPSFPRCGEIPDYIRHFFTPFSSLVGEYEKFSNYATMVRDLIRSATHYQNVEIPWLVRETTTNYVIQMRHLRVSYIVGNNDKNGYVKSILLYERKKQKSLVTRDVIESFTNVLIDYLHILSRFLISKYQSPERNDNIVFDVVRKVGEIISEIDTIRENANDSLKNEFLLLGFTTAPYLGINGIKFTSLSQKRKLCDE